MAENEPKVEGPKTDPDNAPAPVMAALKAAGWEPAGSGTWKKGGDTPIPWAEALMLIGTKPAPAAQEVKPGIRTTEFWVMAPVVLTMISGAVASMTDHVAALPEKARPWAALLLAGMGGGVSALYMWLRTKAKQ